MILYGRIRLFMLLWQNRKYFHVTTNIVLKWNHPSLLDNAEAYELWLKVISMYVLDGAPCPVRMLSRHREMILGNFTSNPQSTDLVKSGNLNPAQHSGSRSASLSNCKINSVNLDKNVLEGLRRAQYVTFITIKVWKVPSSTDHIIMHHTPTRTPLGWSYYYAPHTNSYPIGIPSRYLSEFWRIFSEGKVLWWKTDDSRLSYWLWYVLREIRILKMKNLNHWFLRS